MLRPAVAAIALCATTLAVAAPAPPASRVENRVAGYTLVLPAGWHLVVDARSGTATVATFVSKRPGDVGERVPGGATSVILLDDGPVWGLRGPIREAAPLPSSLPTARVYEGFSARWLIFRTQGHVFDAYVEGAPRTRTTLRVPASLSLTAHGRSLANVSSVRSIGRSVQRRPLRAWRIGNPRSKPRPATIDADRYDCTILRLAEE